jgi:hypothetical protein
MLNDVLLTQQRDLGQRLQASYADREFPAGRLRNHLAGCGPGRRGFKSR